MHRIIVLDKWKLGYWTLKTTPAYPNVLQSKFQPNFCRGFSKMFRSMTPDSHIRAIN